MNEREFQFEWDENKARANLVRHGISFEIARTLFHDPNLLTIADFEHGESEERWFSIGTASNNAMLVVVYTWIEINPSLTKIRIISARRATTTEIREYEGNL